LTIVQRLYIIRHADPEYYGDTLTEHGQLEAEALAKRLANDPQFALTKIYSSPMGRAKATAEYTSKQLGIPIEIEVLFFFCPASVWVCVCVTQLKLGIGLDQGTNTLGSNIQ
jgi:phosphohistidine phosphatase SixA